MQTNPLNVIETSLGDLCGSTHPVKTVAYKIKHGLVARGFVVIPATQVDRLRTLLSYAAVDIHGDVLSEARAILEGWK